MISELVETEPKGIEYPCWLLPDFVLYFFPVMRLVTSDEFAAFWRITARAATKPRTNEGWVPALGDGMGFHPTASFSALG